MTLSPIKIAPVTPDDIPILLELIAGLAEHEKLSHLVTGTAKQLHDGLFASHPYAQAIIARIDGVPTGFALYFYNFSVYLMKPGLFFEALYVLPEYRRLGVGSKILQYLAKIAREKDCGRLECSVLDENENAIAFYQKQGATLLTNWQICRFTGDSLNILAQSSN